MDNYEIFAVNIVPLNQLLIVFNEELHWKIKNQRNITEGNLDLACVSVVEESEMFISRHLQQLVLLTRVGRRDIS